MYIVLFAVYCIYEDKKQNIQKNNGFHLRYLQLFNSRGIPVAMGRPWPAPKNACPPTALLHSLSVRY